MDKRRRRNSKVKRRAAPPIAASASVAVEREPLAVTVRQACKLSGLGQTKIRALIKDGAENRAGGLKATRIGSKTLLINYVSLKELVTGGDVAHAST